MAAVADSYVPSSVSLRAAANVVAPGAIVHNGHFAVARTHHLLMLMLHWNLFGSAAIRGCGSLVLDSAASAEVSRARAR